MTEESLATLLKGAATKGPEGDAGKGDAGEGVLKGENTRLRQEVARLQELTQRAAPFVNAVTALGQSKLGKRVIEKLQKGEDIDSLTAKEGEQVAGAASAVGLSKEDLMGLLDEHGEKLTQKTLEGLRIQMQAQEGVKSLDGWAEKELPGYSKIRGTPAWNGYLDAARAAIANGTLLLPEGEDPWRSLYKRVYNMVVAEDPEIAKEKAAPRESKERLAELLGSNRPAASAVQDKETDIPEEYKRTLEWIRTLKGGTGPAGVGLSFSNPAANKEKE